MRKPKAPKTQIAVKDMREKNSVLMVPHGRRLWQVYISMTSTRQVYISMTGTYLYDKY